MQVISTVADFRLARAALAGTLGFVPTMGYLHDGHLTLVRRARAENDAVAASIFVNPTQFGPKEDLASYPRDLDRDLQLLRGEGVDLVFVPEVNEVYPPGCDTWVEVKGITAPLEGVVRPGHFRGVATVVLKLFNIVRPDKAYFGWKDAQQLLTLKKMAADLDLSLAIVGVPTVREADGLAMSSRNVHLNPAERQAALVLWQAMGLARDLWRLGERSSEAIRRRMLALIEKEPLARVDYVSIASPETLRPVETIDGAALILLAVYIGRTRLIDNLLLGENRA